MDLRNFDNVNTILLLSSLEFYFIFICVFDSESWSISEEYNRITQERRNGQSQHIAELVLLFYKHYQHWERSGTLNQRTIVNCIHSSPYRNLAVGEEWRHS